MVYDRSDMLYQICFPILEEINIHTDQLSRSISLGLGLQETEVRQAIQIWRILLWQVWIIAVFDDANLKISQIYRIFRYMMVIDGLCLVYVSEHMVSFLEDALFWGFVQMKHRVQKWCDLLNKDATYCMCELNQWIAACILMHNFVARIKHN